MKKWVIPLIKSGPILVQNRWLLKKFPEKISEYFSRREYWRNVFDNIEFLLLRIRIIRMPIERNPEKNMWPAYKYKMNVHNLYDLYNLYKYNNVYPYECIQILKEKFKMGYYAQEFYFFTMDDAMEAILQVDSWGLLQKMIYSV